MRLGRTPLVKYFLSPLLLIVSESDSQDVNFRYNNAIGCLFQASFSSLPLFACFFKIPDSMGNHNLLA